MKGNISQHLKAKIEPQLHLRVPQGKGVYGSARWYAIYLFSLGPQILILYRTGATVI